MEFIKFYASDGDDRENENEVEEQPNAEDRNFIDNTKIGQNLSNYYGFTNMTCYFFRRRKR